MSRWPIDLRGAAHRLLARRPRRAAAPQRLYVTLDGCCVVQGAASLEPAPARYDDPAAWCAAHPGATLHLVLSSALTHQLCVDDPALPLTDETAVAAWARHQWLHYHGAAANDWAVTAWCRTDERGAERGACALHGLDLPRLQQAAQAHRVRLQAVQAGWCAALHWVAQQRPSWGHAGVAALWVVEGAQCTRVQVRQGQVQGVRTRWLAAPQAQDLAELLLVTPDADAGHGPVTGDGLLPGDVVVTHGVQAPQGWAPALQAALLVPSSGSSSESAWPRWADAA